MNADGEPDKPAAPLYAITDRRRDGRTRIVQEFTDPHTANIAAELLRTAGAVVDVVLISSIREPEPMPSVRI